MLALLLLFVDFASKAYVYHVLSLKGFYSELPIFKNIGGVDFSISLATNTGAAWGIFSNYQLLLLCVRILVILGIILYLVLNFRTFLKALAFVLIISGAIGNVVDFFVYGFVIDFFKFNLWGYLFPVFNVADSCITIGVFLLFFTGSRKDKELVEDPIPVRRSDSND